MPILTLELIADDPWNAVDLDLPPKADSDFLDVAFNAVNYCVTSQNAVKMAARYRRMAQSPQCTEEVFPNAHGSAEWWLKALTRYEMINERLRMLERSYEDEECDKGMIAEVMNIWIRSLKNVGMFVKYKALRWDG